MGKNYVRLQIGDKERGLKFNLGTLKNIKDLTNGDPFTFFVAGEIEDQIKQVATLLYASLLSNCKSKKEDPDFNYDDCMRWAEDLDLTDAVGLVNAFRDAYKTDASQEGGEDTRTEATNVAAAS